MLNNINMDDLPDELREEMKKAEVLAEKASKKMNEVGQKLLKFIESKAAGDESITEHEFHNALNPLSMVAMGFRPAVVPFEIRGGPSDGKRLITLCVMLADNRTVMPVLQVPDFDTIEGAEYIGSIDGLEIILPGSPDGKGWQETVSNTVEEYEKLYGGRHEI